MSSTAASANLTTTTPARNGLRGWLAVLSPRDRIIYGVLMTMVLAVIGIYMVLAVRLLINMNTSDGSFLSTRAPTSTATAAAAAAANGDDTDPLTPTATSTPDAEVPVSPTGTLRSSATRTPTPVVTPTHSPTTGSTSGSDGSAAVLPTTIASNGPAPGLNTPDPADDQLWLPLYFVDKTVTLFVPLSRSLPSDASSYNDAQIALFVIKELIAGPPQESDLRRSVAHDVSVREIVAEHGTLIVDFARRPADDQELRAIALSLTELPNITRVLFKYNGTTIALPGEDDLTVGRFPFNVYNPRGLPEDFSSRETSFLSLYFLEEDTDSRYVRVTRLVPRTSGPARATVEELLDKPIPFNHLLESPIPQDTSLLGISFASSDKQMIVVNLSQEFAMAANQRAALETLVLSLTDLRNAEGEFIQRVAVQVEGKSLGVVWGAAYDRPFFERPVINPDPDGASLSGM